MKTKPIVVIESPYAGDVETNVRYARACLRDSLLRGEAPVASHLLYTQAGVLDDNVPEQRAMGMEAGWAFFACADLVAVYTDRGVSSGMNRGITRAQQADVRVVFRQLGEGWDT